MSTSKPPLTGEILKPLGNAASSLDALGALTSTIDAAIGYLNLREEEQTKRARIEAYTTLERERVAEASSILKAYFARVFEERAQTFDRLFEALDAGMETGEHDIVGRALDAIVDIAKKSPIAELGDLNKIRAAFDDPDHVWDL